MFARTRRLFDSARGRIEGSGRMQPFRGRLVMLSQQEIELVERVWLATRNAHVRRLAFILSWLGNGPFYILIACLLLCFVDAAAWPVAVAALSISVVHLLYPWIKLACGRPRPFELDRRLVPLLPTLDRHSFPSGHTMTLTAALLPMLAAWPDLWPIALLLWLAMAWSRVACAHHYPSDIIAGTLLGASVAMPLTILFMPPA